MSFFCRLTLDDLRQIPAYVVDWLKSRGNTEIEPLVQALQGAAPPQQMTQQVLVHQPPVQDNQPRMQGPNGQVVKMPERNQPNQMDSPAWLTAGGAPPTLQHAQQAAPVVPSAMPMTSGVPQSMFEPQQAQAMAPMQQPQPYMQQPQMFQPPAQQQMFAPQQTQQPQMFAPQQQMQQPRHTADHLKNVIIPQMVASHGQKALADVMRAAAPMGVQHINQLTDQNTGVLVSAIKQVLGVDV